jgi:hypothetical protein
MTRATWKPATRLPVEMSDPKTATPRTLAAWRVVLTVPVATPERDRSTPPINALVMSGTTNPMPPPRATCWATMSP